MAILEHTKLCRRDEGASVAQLVSTATTDEWLVMRLLVDER